MSRHEHMDHMDHMGHMDHHATTVDNISYERVNDSLASVVTTASSIIESVVTTVMNHGMHDDNDSTMHMHHHTDDMTTVEHHHEGQNHMMMNHGSGGGHMMMYFHSGVDVTILFKEWEVSTVGGLITSIIGIFLLAMLYEGLKFFREYLFKQYFSSLQYTTVSLTDQDGKTVTEIHKIARSRMLSWPHAVQTILHVIQMVISYFLMLIFMTYNIWLCIAVALGAGAGYFLFGWRKATVVDVTEHCH